MDTQEVVRKLLALLAKIAEEISTANGCGEYDPDAWRSPIPIPPLPEAEKVVHNE